MEEFRTIVPIDTPDFQIDFKAPIAFLGSCFSTNMSDKFRASGFEIALNPAGIVFHPMPLADVLGRAIENRLYSENDLIQLGNEWMSLSHHGRFKSNDSQSLLETMNAELSDFREKLERSKVLFITFGTAIGYREMNTSTIVANCHKLPVNRFEKNLSTYKDIVNHMHPVLESVHQFNPSIKIVFTVSPVRYAREGFRSNQLSKSHLHLAVEEFCKRYAFCTYFPAFEIVLDELRDYRFFAADMLHISDLAAEYVFKRLQENYLGAGDLSIAQKISKLSKIVNHKAHDIEKHRLQCLEAEASIIRLLNETGNNQWTKRYRLI